MGLDEVTVQCPKCLKVRTIFKTGRNSQVRCKKTEGGCGAKYYSHSNIFVLKKPKVETKPKTNKTQLFNHNGSLESLVIMANYAINTIKNKKEVKEQDPDSTWYQHYLSWTKWRKTFQIALEEKG